MAELNRERIIELLNRLGSEDDADVVKAARTLHREVTAAGFGWDALLTPEKVDEPAPPDEEEEEAAAEEEEYEDEDKDKDEREEEDEDKDKDEREEEDEDEREEEDEGEAEPEPDTEAEIDAEALAEKVHDSRDAESLALIEKLLARRRLGEATRVELNGYREDIAEGEFDEADRKYVRALHARISKRR